MSSCFLTIFYVFEYTFINFFSEAGYHLEGKFPTPDESSFLRVHTIVQMKSSAPPPGFSATFLKGILQE